MPPRQLARCGLGHAGPSIPRRIHSKCGEMAVKQLLTRYGGALLLIGVVVAINANIHPRSATPWHPRITLPVIGIIGISWFERVVCGVIRAKRTRF
jgi:hypothetical protein